MTRVSLTYKTLRRVAMIFLFLLASAIFLARAGTPAINDDSDGIYAEVPREMVATGDWITPHADGVRYLEKPPLLYWLTAISYRIGGVHEVTARLPVLIAAVVTVWLCFLIGELCFGLTAGLWAGVVMATAPGYYLFTQEIMPDTLFTALLALAFYAYLRGYVEASRRPGPGRALRWYLLFYAGVALAVLAKGLIGLVFPALTIAAFLALNSETGRWREMRPALGALVVLAVAAPWHLAVGLRNPGFFWFYFINEHVLRFLNRRTPRDYGTVPLPAFWGLHAIWFFPWSFLLALRRRAAVYDSSSAVSARLSRFPLVWTGAVLIFFSFSTRLEYYSMPAYPAIAVMIGGAISGLLHAKRRRRVPAVEECRRSLAGSDTGPRRDLVRACAGLFAVGMLAFAAMLVVLWVTRYHAGPRAPLIDPQSPYSVFFFSPVFHFSPESLRLLRVPIIGVASSLFAGTLLALIFSLRAGPRPVLLALAGMILAVLPGMHNCEVIFQEDLSSHALAQVIRAQAGPTDLIVADGQFELFSSLAFYTGRSIAVRDGRKGYLEYGSRYPDCPPIFLTNREFVNLWSSGRHVFYAARKGSPLPDAGRLCRILATSDNQVLLDNRSLTLRPSIATDGHSPQRNSGSRSNHG